MLVSTSFLSSKNIPSDLQKLDISSTDYIHVDIMDGKFVNNKTMPFSEMKNISKFTKKRLDVHLMVENPKKYIDNYALLNTEFITVHIELEDHIEEYLNQIKSYGIKCGLAINPSTEIKEIVPYLPLIDMVIIMSVEPGSGGQSFIENSENKINELRILSDEYNKDLIISVDGGINDETKNKCYNCDMLVSGSYIINSSDFEKRINSLR